MAICENKGVICYTIVSVDANPYGRLNGMNCKFKVGQQAHRGSAGKYNEKPQLTVLKRTKKQGSNQQSNQRPRQIKLSEA